MTTTAEFLRRYQSWRRDNTGDLPRPDPREVGAAIDEAIAAIEERDALREELDALKAWKKEIEKQEPVAWIITGSITRDEALAKANKQNAAPLFAYPIPPAQIVPDGWIERGIAELEKIRDEEGLCSDRVLIERLILAVLAAAPKPENKQGRCLNSPCVDVVPGTTTTYRATAPKPEVKS